MRRFDLGIALNYCQQWGINEAVREYFQNALDAEVTNSDNKMYFEYDEASSTLRIGNKNGKLTTNTLLLGMSSKVGDEKTIGQHGEGYKVATVVLLRLGKTVKIYNRSDKEVWTARVIKSRRYNADVVVFDIENVSIFKSVPNMDLVFEIGGVSKEEYDSIIESNLHLQDIAEEDYIDANGSRVLLSDEHAGKVFVNGLFVCKSKYLNYGYDFEPSLVKLDRDRGLIDSLDLQFICGRVICRTGESDFIKDAKNTWDGEYIRYYLTDAYVSNLGEIYDSEYDDFIAKYGSDAVPTTDYFEFNRLKRSGYNVVMVSNNQYHYITRSSSYTQVKTDAENATSEELAERLEDWFNTYIEEGSKAYEEGKDLIDSIVSRLNK